MGVLPRGCVQLIQRFKGGGFAGAADQLASALYDVEVYRSERSSLLETPDGYKIRRGTGHPELISNFTLRLLQNVTFGESVPLHHTAAIHLEHREFNTIIPDCPSMSIGKHCTSDPATA